MAGAAGFAVYMAYPSFPFFLTYLDELHTLPILAISVFGILSTSGGRIAIAFPSGFIADRFFGGSAGGIRAKKNIKEMLNKFKKIGKKYKAIQKKS